ncbi:MAG: aldehyde ferredoxin oxidoreductase family protein [Dehalococcoidia bacterium]|nr:MAG: aldehyde ferredoxin oxidoreductase family protein [Dehalococcoidia bacterium]
MLTGYIGKLLRVDLTDGQIFEESLNEDYTQAFIGGSGLGARYLYGMTDKKTDPQGADNPLIFMTGPLTGTKAPCCGRYSVCARSPLTGLWGEANSGGEFGPVLKFSGFDGIIITGCSSKPVYLEIIDGMPRLKNASHIWGMDCYQTQQVIKTETQRSKISIACIGVAGENKSKLAAIVNDQGRTAARTGLGAVMGFKQLKAIAVSGNNQPKVADEIVFKTAVHEAHEFLKEDISAEMFRLGGTAFYMDVGMMYGDIPTRYFTQGEFDVSKLTGATLSETILTETVGCYRCPIACGRKTTLDKYDVTDVDGPEYETISALGTLLLIDDLQGIAYAGHLCNLYGVDTISAGVTIAFAVYLFEKGILKLSDTDGIELKWGDINTVIRLIEKMAYRDGFGDILADGSSVLGKRYAVEDIAVQVKGLEVAMHDPRAFSGMAVAYATAPRGGCHLESDFYLAEIGQEFPEVGIIASPRGKWTESSSEKVQTVSRHQDWRSLYDSLIICKFAGYSGNLVTKLVNATTGWHITPQKLITVGERIFNLKRLINIKFGLTTKEDKLPKLLLKPLSEGGAKDKVPNIEMMLDEYYRFRQWDRKTGLPTSEKIKELGLFQFV